MAGAAFRVSFSPAVESGVTGSRFQYYQTLSKGNHEPGEPWVFSSRTRTVWAMSLHIVFRAVGIGAFLALILVIVVLTA